MASKVVIVLMIATNTVMITYPQEWDLLRFLNSRTVLSRIWLVAALEIFTSSISFSISCFRSENCLFWIVWRLFEWSFHFSKTAATSSTSCWRNSWWFFLVCSRSLDLMLCLVLLSFYFVGSNGLCMVFVYGFGHHFISCRRRDIWCGHEVLI